MPESEIIKNSLKKSSGAHFYRCSLQVNPHHYAETYRHTPHGLDEEAYIREIIKKSVEMSIQILAITDHNHVGSIDKFREVGRQEGIIIFPGFELESNEGVHILCIYPLETEQRTLKRYLGEFGIREAVPSTTPSIKGFSDILDMVKKQKGITIAAHVTQSKGLFHSLEGQARIRLWKDPNLLAIQIPGAIDGLPISEKKIVVNQEPQYARQLVRDPRLALAVVNSSDISEPNDLVHPSATSLIKMSEVSIEGLRQAFLDPISRIRLNSDPIPEEHTEFRVLAWQGGFLDGCSVHFNENMNVLIGGRGTGKSTFIESLRYTLGLEPLGEEAKKSHEGILNQVLQSGTKISLLVRSYRPAKREYLIERTIPNPPVVRDESGNVLNVQPRDIIHAAEVYGQHELAELTRSPEKLTMLLDRFAERDTNLMAKKSEAQRALERSRLAILEAEKEINQIQEDLGRLPALEETLKSYQEAGLEQKLSDRAFVVREEAILKAAKEKISPFGESWGNWKTSCPSILIS